MRHFLLSLFALVLVAGLWQCQPQGAGEKTATSDTVIVHDTVTVEKEPRRYVLALDLKDDSALIAEYEKHHENVWPEILKAIDTVGIREMEIYRTGTRLVMIMEVSEDFTFQRMDRYMSNLEKNQEWEELMWKYQKPLPWAEEGQKWIRMKKIFTFSEQFERLER